MSKGKWHYYKITEILNSDYYSFEDTDRAKEYLRKTVEDKGFISGLYKALNPQKVL